MDAENTKTSLVQTEVIIYKISRKPENRVFNVKNLRKALDVVSKLVKFYSPTFSCKLQFTSNIGVGCYYIVVSITNHVCFIKINNRNFLAIGASNHSAKAQM